MFGCAIEYANYMAISAITSNETQTAQFTGEELRATFMGFAK
jgi:hypothetical protein